MKLLTLGFTACLMMLTAPVRADTLAQGEDLYKKKQFSQARQIYLAVARDSTVTSLSTAAKYRAAACLFDLRDYEVFKTEATALLGQGQKVPPGKLVPVKFRVAQLPFVQGNWAEAAQTLGQFARDYPRGKYAFDAVNKQAVALTRLNRLAEARQVFLDYIDTHQNGPFVEAASLKAALRLYDLKSYDAFEREGRIVLAKYPANVGIEAERIQLRLAQIPGFHGRWEESALRLEARIKANPQNTFVNALFNCGKAWLMAGEQASRQGKAEPAAQFKAKGISHLLRTRSELGVQLAQGKKGRADENARMIFLETYYLEKNYQGLAQAAKLLTTEFHPPSLLWARGMVFLGMACLNQEPRDLDGAASAFDAVIAANVMDPNLTEHLPTLGLYWRMTVAQEKKDDAALQACLGRLAAMPDGPYKRSALAKFGKLPK